jgi:hypothetical protein
LASFGAGGPRISRAFLSSGPTADSRDRNWLCFVGGAEGWLRSAHLVYPSRSFRSRSRPNQRRPLASFGRMQGVDPARKRPSLVSCFLGWLGSELASFRGRDRALGSVGAFVIGFGRRFLSLGSVGAFVVGFGRRFRHWVRSALSVIGFGRRFRSLASVGAFVVGFGRRFRFDRDRRSSGHEAPSSILPKRCSYHRSPDAPGSENRENASFRRVRLAGIRASRAVSIDSSQANKTENRGQR